jgi:hypothetical protein
MTSRIPLELEEAIERAVATCARVHGGGGAGAPAREQAFYKLGTGGRHPEHAAPWDARRQCDCSGFIAWIFGYDRYLGDDVWINTDAIVRQDAGLYAAVAAEDEVVAGDVLVYGSTYLNGERRPGHVGMITEIAAGFVRDDADWWRQLKVAHCSPSNSRQLGLGHAIAETDARIWRARGRFVRFRSFAAAG